MNKTPTMQASVSEVLMSARRAECGLRTQYWPVALISDPPADDSAGSNAEFSSRCCKASTSRAICLE